MEYRFFDQIENDWVSEEWIAENSKEVLDWVLYGKSIPKEILVNRCTGLKDKNGKLIYEGDVLFTDKIPEMPCDTGVIRFGEYEYLDTDHTGFYIEYDYGTESIAEELNVLEIIGNTYENPELLNKIEKQ